MKKVGIIGAGFSSMAAACYLAKSGYIVEVFDNHSTAGGRARKFETQDFVFDMGPSWYWMPDVFENFFADFNKKPSDYYQLKRLDPSYKIFFKDSEVNIPANLEELKNLFESWEKGSANNLDKFLAEAEVKYNLGMNKLVQKPGKSLFEFAEADVFKNLFKLHIFQSFKKHTDKYFKDPRILQILEFPILFLGATAKTTPALYSLMNFADIKLGTWYPDGGMNKIAEGMEKLALDLGVKFHFSANITKINCLNGKAQSLQLQNTEHPFDHVVAGADYNFVEQNLLEKPFRNYTKNYWENREMAPSSLIFYIGVNQKIKNLEHHNLFFDEDFNLHAKELYQNPKWPTAPLFYVCCPSKTDSSVAPPQAENLFILMPLAPGIEDNQSLRDQYFELILNRLQARTGVDFKAQIVYKKDFAINDFKSQYNAYKGNAYGLANTLKQTAVLKPSVRNKKIKNLYYTGQLTVPGPGVPPSLISGKIVANEIINQL